jgi:hypothetical protein
VNNVMATIVVDICIKLVRLQIAFTDQQIWIKMLTK